jgi:hypothetical protein
VHCVESRGLGGTANKPSKAGERSIMVEIGGSRPRNVEDVAICEASIIRTAKINAERIHISGLVTRIQGDGNKRAWGNKDLSVRPTIGVLC